MNISLKFLSLFLCLWPLATLSQEAAAVVEDEERPASRRLGYWFGYDTIESFVGQNSRLSTLYGALVAIEAAPGGVLDTDELGLLTLFAPTNWAFDRTFATYPGLDELLLGDPALLETVLLYHVVAAEVLPIDIPEEGVEVTTAGGETFIAFRECHMWGWWCYVGIQDGSLDVTWVTGFNRFATNGVTHLIDKVLIPPSLAEAVEGLRPV